MSRWLTWLAPGLSSETYTTSSRQRPDLGFVASLADGAAGQVRCNTSRCPGASSLHDCGAAVAAAARDAPHVPGDRRAPVRVAEHGEDPGDLDLPEAGGVVAQRRHRTGPGVRSSRQLTAAVHPDWMMRARSSWGRMRSLGAPVRHERRGRCVRQDSATQRRLRQTADRAEDDIAAEAVTWARSSTCEQADAIARVAALIASGAGDSAYRRCVRSAVATGATPDELINMLRGVARSVGIARVVAATPALALALGYNIDAADRRAAASKRRFGACLPSRRMRPP